MKRGQTKLCAADFYDPEMKEIEIPLNPAISPQQNAAKFYKDYQKAKTAEKVLTEQIARGEQELAYLASVLDALTRAESVRDLQEIRAELVSGGYLRQTDRKKQMKLPPSRPMRAPKKKICWKKTTNFVPSLPTFPTAHTAVCPNF